ncbi:Mini-ribonuclease [Actinidia chinensis var. chinensis]|uniref:Mini-ribonuclease n=1 Tax=Actinidia chinensis var. chinensis TaxID=1590841 RepID=A0A2R6QFE6_ACTCC|nr:Mini-ribonuclease [Actinidia chinensis var. chinensis]
MVAASLSSLFSVKAASWDTQQRLPYNRQRTKPKKTQNPNTASSTTTTTPQSLSLTTSISALLSRNIQSPIQGKFEETYLGYEAWLPTPPKVEKPRSIYNAASLAYIGDSIYELYARRHFLFPPLNIEEYNDRVMAVVRCEAQDAMLQKLLNEKCLTEEERDIIRWGKNIGSAKTRTKKRVGAAVYNRASSLETLVGYLYLTNVKRLEEIMLKLGFSGVPSPS